VKFKFLILCAVLSLSFCACNKKDDVTIQYSSSTESNEDNVDLNSINAKIKKDNEALGVFAPIEDNTEVSGNDLYKLSEIEAVVEDFTDSIDVSDVEGLEFKYADSITYKDTITGAGISLEQLEPILFEDNYGIILSMTDMVFVKSIDENTCVVKLSSGRNDVAIIKCYEGEPTLGGLDNGQMFSGSYYIDNMTTDYIDGVKVVLITYEGFTYRQE